MAKKARELSDVCHDLGDEGFEANIDGILYCRLAFKKDRKVECPHLAKEPDEWSGLKRCNSYRKADWYANGYKPKRD